MSDSVALKNKEQELKKLHTMRLVRTLLPIVGLIIVFFLFLLAVQFAYNMYVLVRKIDILNKFIYLYILISFFICFLL